MQRQIRLPLVKKPLPVTPLACKSWRHADALFAEYLKPIGITSAGRNEYHYLQMARVCILPLGDLSRLPPRGDS